MVENNGLAREYRQPDGRRAWPFLGALLCVALLACKVETGSSGTAGPEVAQDPSRQSNFVALVEDVLAGAAGVRVDAARAGVGDAARAAARRPPVTAEAQLPGPTRTETRRALLQASMGPFGVFVTRDAPDVPEYWFRPVGARESLAFDAAGVTGPALQLSAGSVGRWAGLLSVFSRDQAGRTPVSLVLRQWSDPTLPAVGTAASGYQELGYWLIVPDPWSLATTPVFGAFASDAAAVGPDDLDALDQVASDVGTVRYAGPAFAVLWNGVGLSELVGEVELAATFRGEGIRSATLGGVVELPGVPEVVLAETPVGPAGTFAGATMLAEGLFDSAESAGAGTWGAAFGLARTVAGRPGMVTGTFGYDQLGLPGVARGFALSGAFGADALQE